MAAHRARVIVENQARYEAQQLQLALHERQVTVAEALYHGLHEEDSYFSYELSRRDGGRGGNGQASAGGVITLSRS
jgi:hypothetical protein